MQQNDTAPTTTVTTRANRVRLGTCTPYATQPMPSSTATMTSATHTDVNARPAMIAADGTGVARRRFSTPLSRCAVTAMTRLMKDAAMMPSVMIPGTYDTLADTLPPGMRVD